MLKQTFQSIHPNSNRNWFINWFQLELVIWNFQHGKLFYMCLDKYPKLQIDVSKSNEENKRYCYVNVALKNIYMIGHLISIQTEGHNVHFFFFFFAPSQHQCQQPTSTVNTVLTCQDDWLDPSSAMANCQQMNFLFVSADSKPMSRVMAVSPGRSSVPVGFVSVLVGIRVIFFHQRVVISAMLGTGRQAVPTLSRPFIVIIFIGGHQTSSFNW